MNGPFAVYKRGLGYNDEYYYFDADPVLERAVQRWRDGDGSEFRRLFAQLGGITEYPDELVSRHQSLEEAMAAAQALHVEECRNLKFVDMGFHSYGCRPEPTRRYDDAEEPEVEQDGANDDIDRLRRWCERNAVTMPALADGSPETRSRIEAIAETSMEGRVWLDYVDHDGIQPFAADLVAEELWREDRSELAADLWRELVCELAYVGPDPHAHDPRGPDAHDGTAPTRGLLSRILNRK